MKLSKLKIISTLFLSSQVLWSQARVMNPGEAVGQIVIISAEDLAKETVKYKSLNPLSIPVFAELPADLSVIAGSITLKQQNVLSHVQIKAGARKTPNLDISELEGALSNPTMELVKDGAWIRMKLSPEGGISLSPATQTEAEEFYENKKTVQVNLQSDLSFKKIPSTSELGWQDFISVGSKAANYGELAKALNSPERTVVRPGFAVPFAYYQEFIESNPNIKQAIKDLLEDPIMNEVADVQYRAEQLESLRKLMQDPQAVVSQELVDSLLKIFDEQKTPKGKLRKMKLRSSTNSEDLPNFNGAGLYTSDSYKPTKDDKEKSRKDKEKSLRAVLQLVWSSVWELRAYDERNYFSIPHDQVKMGMQVNPSFGDEDADGVVVTKNISDLPEYKDLPGVYIEAQRGDKHSVANPQEGAKPQKILVLFDATVPLDLAKYQIKVLQNSNIGNDNETILTSDNPTPVMFDEEIKDLTYLVLKAKQHFKPLHGKDNPNFELDLEFKVDSADTGARKVLLKQARPFID